MYKWHIQRKLSRSSKRREENYGKIIADEWVFITGHDQSDQTVTERWGHGGEQKSDDWIENQGGQGHSPQGPFQQQMGPWKAKFQWAEQRRVETQENKCELLVLKGWIVNEGERAVDDDVCWAKFLFYLFFRDLEKIQIYIFFPHGEHVPWAILSSPCSAFFPNWLIL